jgi:hypothetical protein
MSEIIFIARPDSNEAQPLSNQMTALSKKFVIPEADPTENNFNRECTCLHREERTELTIKNCCSTAYTGMDPTAFF